MKPPKRKLIILLSIIVPIVVALLFGIRIETETDFSFLPHVYAVINSLTFVLLIIAFWMIKIGNKKAHQAFIITCIGLTTIFLVLYIIYHITSDSTPYGGEGIMRYVYFTILVSHILLSVGVIPLVLFSLGWASEGMFVRHKRIARVAMPIWMYVAFTGVLVYLMISPYYA